MAIGSLCHRRSLIFPPEGVHTERGSSKRFAKVTNHFLAMYDKDSSGDEILLGRQADAWAIGCRADLPTR